MAFSSTLPLTSQSTSMPTRSRIFPALVLGALALAACAPDSPTAPLTPRPLASRGTSAGGGRTYIVATTGDSLPTALDADVEAAGGQVRRSLGEAGVAVVQSSDPAFAARATKIRGVSYVVPDTMVQWVAPTAVRQLGDESPPPARATSIGDGEPYFFLQWAPRAIRAPAAWNAGALGEGVRVAVIDGGIYARHVDIAPNLDVARSTSFVPGVPFDSDGDPSIFWHATHVAGIIAAAANHIGTIGIAPRATIVGVKALDDGSGLFSWVIQAIYYAATPVSEGGAGANVINMSLGATIPRHGRDADLLADALDRATTYAWRRGVTVVAAAGNSGENFDLIRDSLVVPAQSAHVIAVDATGPTDFIHGGTNFTRIASYTNTGRSLVTFAAPGGDFVSAAGFPFDLVLAPCRGAGATTSAYCFAAGTSMAAPEVSGVAALVIGRAGGELRPEGVLRILRRSADDLGAPGRDPLYGYGFIDAGGAVGAVHGHDDGQAAHDRGAHAMH